jgi:hypothetical protein
MVMVVWVVMLCHGGEGVVVVVVWVVMLCH